MLWGVSWVGGSPCFSRDARWQSSAEGVAAQQRHADVTNDKAVFGLLFGAEVQVDAVAQAELAYILAGVGGRPRRRWATWRQPGRGAPARPLELSLQPEGPACEPLRPMQYCAWQGLDALGPAARWLYTTKFL